MLQAPDLNEKRNKSQVRLLLINPKFPESFWSFRWAIKKVLSNIRAVNPPLGLATVAALCPSDWQITIIDENIESIPLAPEADIVGVGGMGVQFSRQLELLQFYRRQGYYTVAGGSYASLCPERYTDLADTVISGEAERIWPGFCRDFELDAAKSFYKETGIVALEESPTPRYDLLKLAEYTTATMQFSRGCPFLCEFCDIIVMFGRRPRTKRTEQIEAELDLLRSRGVSKVFFVDDNLIGNKKAAGRLLRFLADYQSVHKYGFRFGTEVSLNIARDKELLGLLRDANFNWVFIGIESPDEKTLQETRKVQNMHTDILTAVRTIHGYGIDVFAGFIIGFDNDSVNTFDRQYHFINVSGIVVAMVGLLTALPGTPLYKRLKGEGRLLADVKPGDNTKLSTNFLPKLMDYDAMISGYNKLCRQLFSDRSLGDRIRNKARYFKATAYQGKYTIIEGLGIVIRLVFRGLLPGGPVRMYRFLRTLLVHPRAWPQVIEDWIAGLALLDYIKRHFHANVKRDLNLVQKTVLSISKLCASAIRRGTLEIVTNLEENHVNLMVLLKGRIEEVFYTSATRKLQKLLSRTTTTMTLCIDDLYHEQPGSLEQLLQRLAPWGDRVSVWVSDHARPLARVDSSVFHLLLSERPMSLVQR